MKRTKVLHNVILLTIGIFSAVIIYFCINYNYNILHNMQYLFHHHMVNIGIGSNIYIFNIEIIMILLIYFITRRFPKIKLLFILTVVTLNLIYIIWRIKYTIPTTSKIGMTLGIMLIACEVIGFFQSVVYGILFYKPYELKEMKMSDLSKLPTIDLLIMTYNEPSYILRKTIAGCLNIKY
ncbi:hypothetical protein ACJDU8_00460 [Clostridium sp. WILCCON 0269]|uniref:Uncharacterized protein n=1 Tax=Candidatus Clostridium eludens TaxID=3381663 RepID=A0ABW8SDG5_9CLOT